MSSVAPRRSGSASNAAPRFGYLVPEFPGQTHAFFWREIAALRALGADPVLLSTRRPPAGVVAHTWSDEAVAQTVYLDRLRPGGLLAAAAVLLRALARGRLPRAVREASSAGSWAGRAALLAGAASLAGAARRLHLPHVHVHSAGGSAQLALIARLLGGPGYSITLHGPLADYGPRQREKWSGAEFGLVITTVLRRAMERELGAAAPDRLAVAPMGVDVAAFTRTGEYRPWNGEGPLRLVSCGRLNPAKGHDTVLRALVVLRDAGVDARLHVAGEDDLGGTGYRRELETMIARCELGDRVELLGAIDEDRVRRELSAAHLFVLASHAEPLGVAIMEAMAMAVPVVVGRGGGVGELIDDGVHGVLADPESVADLVSALRSVADDPARATRLSDAGRQRVQSAFDSARSAAALRDAVAETLR